ncbi:hypothetical protein [Staphylococcus aureus]|uniref:hypothetical protein n=1 Tax=Staphylococcus aureus TaxID=1280 RepID=UPI003520313C
MVKIQDRALIAGAKIMVEEVKKQLKPSKKTGALINEVTFTDPEWIKGKRTITIHWREPKERYRLVHLIENGHVQKGTGKFIKPKAMGGVNRAIRQVQNKYFETLKRELKKL